MPEKSVDKDFSQLLDTFPPAVRTVAVEARRLILATIPGASEEVDSKARVIGYGIGGGYSGMICTIILSKTGVKLGLVKSASWPDPDGLLEGTGKVHRYVACETVADVRRPGVKRLLKYASTTRG